MNLSCHKYRHGDTREEEARKSVAVVKTVPRHPYQHSHHFGANVGVLQWGNVPRKFETIEVSIKFEEEDEEEEEEEINGHQKLKENMTFKKEIQI